MTTNNSTQLEHILGLIETLEDAVKGAMIDPSPPETTGYNRIEKALQIAENFGGIDGAHHKMWVIDQMVRVLTGEHYDQWVKDVCKGEDGPDTYEWDVGIAP